MPCGGFGDARLDVEHCVQRDSGRYSPRTRTTRSPPATVLMSLGDRLQRLHHEVQRQDEDLVADLDRHAVEDRQRQRQRRSAMVVPLPLARADLDGAAHRLDVALDDVHADAAARRRR